MKLSEVKRIEAKKTIFEFQQSEVFVSRVVFSFKCMYVLYCTYPRRAKRKEPVFWPDQIVGFIKEISECMLSYV